MCKIKYTGLLFVFYLLVISPLPCFAETVQEEVTKLLEKQDRQLLNSEIALWKVFAYVKSLEQELWTSKENSQKAISDIRNLLIVSELEQKKQQALSEKLVKQIESLERSLAASKIEICFTWGTLGAAGLFMLIYGLIRSDQVLCWTGAALTLVFGVRLVVFLN